MNAHMPLETFVPPTVHGPVKFGPDAGQNLTPHQHGRLVAHLFKLLRRDAPHLSFRRSSMQSIETDLLGVVVPEGTDSERRQKRDEGRAVAVPDAIYPFGWLTLQQFASELGSIVMPAEAPYAVVTQGDTQGMADKITRAFRHQGVMFSHRSNFNAALFDTLALDCGVLFYEWDKIAKPNIERSMLNKMMVSPGETAGLNVRHADPYNVSWDPNVSVRDLARHGEFIAEFRPQTAFALRRAALRGECFLDEDMLKALDEEACHEPRRHNWGQKINVQASENYWLHYSPAIAHSRELAHRMFGSNQIQTNFTGLFTGTADPRTSALRDRRDLIHMTRMLVRLKPGDWGLANSNMAERAKKDAPFEIWEIHLAGPGIVSLARQVNVEVDLLPAAVATMNYDRPAGRSFKFGEHAAQMGLLASTILNLHKRGMRKGLEGGVTIYNPNVIPMDRLDDMSGGRLPTKQMKFDDDLRKHVLQLNTPVDSHGNINDAIALQNMLTSLFPTNSQPAMAGLDRATTYQAQAVLMTGMRSLLFYACNIDDQLGIPTRFNLQHQNMINQNPLTYIDERSQQAFEIAQQELEQSQFMLTQAQPLIGIDRLRATNELRDMINILMQSGGQLPPLAAMFLRHYIQMAGQPIDPEVYEAALAQQMEFNAAQNAPDGQQPPQGGGQPGPGAPPQV